MVFYLYLMCCDTSGSWSEGRVGGPCGVGEGHTSLAICPAGPGQVVPPASPKYWFYQPWTIPGGEASQGNATHFHGIRSIGKIEHFLVILSKCFKSNKSFFFFYSTCLSFLRWLCFWNFKKRQIISSHQKKKTLASQNFEPLHSGTNDPVKMVLEWFELSFQQCSRVIRNPLISFKRLFINIHQLDRSSFIFILPFATLQLVLSHYEIYHLRNTDFRWFL